MQRIYTDTARMLKALSDPKRLRIADMLSCGEMCACRILEKFDISQPTLSHDMRVLMEAGIVRDRRDGKNIYYSLNKKRAALLKRTLRGILSPKPGCICGKENANER